MIFHVCEELSHQSTFPQHNNSDGSMWSKTAPESKKLADSILHLFHLDCSITLYLVILSLKSNLLNQIGQIFENNKKKTHCTNSLKQNIFTFHFFSPHRDALKRKTSPNPLLKEEKRCIFMSAVKRDPFLHMNFYCNKGSGPLGP